MKNNFRKYLAGLGIFVLMVSLSCSKREESATNAPGATTYTQAESILTSIGASLSFPSISDFSDSTGATSTGLASLISTQGNLDASKFSTSNFDSTKFNSLDSAIVMMQSALTSYSAAPRKNMPALSPSLIDTTSSSKNISIGYTHLYLGYLYTLHAALRLKHFVIAGFIVLNGNKYELNVGNATLANLETKGVQAILDAYYLLNGDKLMVTAAQTGTTDVHVSAYIHAGPTQCASYHLDQAVIYLGAAFPQINDALVALNKNSFKAFFDDLKAKAQTLGIVQTDR